VLGNLYTIPYTDANSFPGVDDGNYGDTGVKDGFTGALVYHEGGNGIPAGIYVWNGTNWSPVKENCTPLDAAELKVTPEIVFAKVDANVTFSVSSGAGSRCAEGETYDWHVNGASATSATSAYPASTWTTSFNSAETYKVQVKASNLYNDPLSKVPSNEATVYVTDDGGLPPVLINGDYRISGGYCYDVKGSKKDSESPENYEARVDSFETGYTKTFLFNHTQDFTNLSVLMPNDPVGIVASISQPTSDTGNNSGSVSFTVTFKDNVQQLVVDNNAPAAVKLLVSYMDNNSNPKMASLDIRVQDAGCYCPAQVPTSIHPLGSLIFMCGNLGADYEIRSVADIGKIDVNNFREYHGDWYRFGVKTVTLENIASNDVFNDPTEWAKLPIYMGPDDWSQDDDPCPSGWRIPSIDEWSAVISISIDDVNNGIFSNVTPVNNTLTRYKGTAVSSDWRWTYLYPPLGGYNNVLQIGDYLFLPAAGLRSNGNDDSGGGILTNHGGVGYYHCRTARYAPNAWGMSFTPLSQTVGNSARIHGMSVRCVQAE
jgi:hypothetical protein